jgi:hypothetical protein
MERKTMAHELNNERVQPVTRFPMIPLMEPRNTKGHQLKSLSNVCLVESSLLHGEDRTNMPK